MVAQFVETSVTRPQMRAIVCRTTGRPADLRVEAIEQPGLGPETVLVRVRASSVNPVDFFPLTPVAYGARRLRSRGKPAPVILGTDFAGVVDSVGSAVTQFKPGDAVFGGALGAFAQYVAIAESGAVVHKPDDVPFESAAVVPVAAVTALQAVRDHGRIQPGQKVLVNGASGGVGSFALQLAKVFGADVTAVCSPRNTGTAQTLGADRVIDYMTADFTRSSDRYDVMLDVAGSHSWRENMRVLKPRGTYVLVGASAHTPKGSGGAIMHILRSRFASLFSSRRFVFFIAKLRKDDLAFLGGLLADGRLTTVIDRQYELDDISAAMTYMHLGHARGKIIVRV